MIFAQPNRSARPMLDKKMPQKELKMKLQQSQGTVGANRGGSSY